MDIRERVQQYIDSSGFPLEFFAADNLAAAGFLPRHGRTYESRPTLGADVVHREIDVLAELPDARLARPAALVVECKRAMAPWVVIVGERDPEPQLQVVHRRGHGKPLKRELARAARQALGIVPPLAFGLTKVRNPSKGGGEREDPTDPFDAVRQVLSAAVGATSMLPAGAIVHPVLVVEGRLFRYQHGLEVAEVPAARMVWWGAPTGPMPVVLDVVSRVGFDVAYVLGLRDDLVRLSHVLGADQGPATP